MEALDKLKQNSSVFGLTPEQIQKNFERIQSQNKNTPKVATDIGVSQTPELYQPRRSMIDTAGQNIMSSGNYIENYLNTLSSPDITQEDIVQAKAGITRQMLDLIKGKESKAEITADAYKAEDITGKRELVQDYTNQLEAERRSLDLAIRDLPQEGTVSKRFRQGQIDVLKTNSLRKQADLAILANSAIGNLQVAQQNVQDRIQLEYGPIEEEYNTFIASIDAVSGLEAEVKNQLKQQAQDQKALADTNQARVQALYELAIDAQKSGNPSLAQQFIRQANQITPDLDEETSNQIFNSAQQQAITGGVYSGSGVGQSVLSKEDFTTRLQNQRLQSIPPEMVDQQYEDYVREALFDNGSLQFTSTDYKKLAGAGLLASPLQEQLNYLYGDESALLVNPFE